MRYLEALRSGNLATAYELTQLPMLARTRAGAPLTKEHFVAFFEADPIRDFSIGRVTELEIRTAGTTQSSPYFEVDVTLVAATGSRAATLTVAQPGTVQVEPARVIVEAGRAVTSVVLDGIRTPTEPTPAGRRLSLLVLDGSHALRIGGASVRFATSPLLVLDGPASIEGGVLRFDT